MIERAILQGLDALKSSKRIKVAQCGEVEITDELERLLNLMLESRPSVVPGFTKVVFQTVIRGGEMRNHDRTAPEKRPDLTFRSMRIRPGLACPEQCALLVECKIVDTKHPMHLYCGDGLMRFVDGTYAWTVSSAMMVGYARNCYEPSVHLHEHLSKSGARYGLVEPLVVRPGSVAEPKFYLTVHNRKIKGMPRGPKGRITIHHVWVEVA